MTDSSPVVSSSSLTDLWPETGSSGPESSLGSSGSVYGFRSQPRVPKSSDSSSSIRSSSRTWIPGHCMKRQNLAVQDPNCPLGYTWRKGHKRNPAPVEETHKYMHKFSKTVAHVLARNPVLCQNFEDLPQFKNCLLLVKKSLQSFFLKSPSKAEVRRYLEHLIDRTIKCAGMKLQDQCYLQPTTKMRRYIRNTVQRYVDAYLLSDENEE